jgi:hypothetical protein
MPDAVDYAQELEERHRVQALARILARFPAPAPKPPQPVKDAEDDA